jgi:hypothetical protein
MPALPYLLLRAPVEERDRAHRLLDLSDLQLGPIHACLLAHQLSYTLALLFLAQVSRNRLLASLVSSRTSYATTGGAVRSPERLEHRTGALPFPAPPRPSEAIVAAL